jgi:hypothetical protein
VAAAAAAAMMMMMICATKTEQEKRTKLIFPPPIYIRITFCAERAIERVSERPRLQTITALL